MKHQPVPQDDLRERFILFLAGKPAGRRYVWKSLRHCACGTFIRECLDQRPWYVRWGRCPRENEVWARWNDVARSCSTYGELLHKVRDA